MSSSVQSTSSECEETIRLQRNKIEKEDEGKQETSAEDEDEDGEVLLQNLRKDRGWSTEHLVEYEGFWLTPGFELEAVVIRDHFKARATDIFLTSFPKSGTIWLKALIFATSNRTLFHVSSSHHPLLTTFPHQHFLILDAYILKNHHLSRPNISHDHDDDDGNSAPRLFSTHKPYSLLPKSVTGGCGRVVHICRNPKDVLISKWIFMNKLRPKHLQPLSLEEAFELFCGGVSDTGPFWEHVLGFWKASLEFPHKVLFLKYEELKKDPIVHVKKMAEFLGQPFSTEEESQGVVEQIVKLCSFENLSSLEVNKSGRMQQNVLNNGDFFRKGRVGDWRNYITDEMGRRLDQISDEKLNGSGLTFDDA